MEAEVHQLRPETARQMREIAHEVFQEQRQDILKMLERKIYPLWSPRPMWPDWVETMLQELTEAQKRTEATVQELAEAQKRTEERLARLETTVQELAEAQKRTEARVEELAEAQKRTEERLARLETTVQELAEAQKRTEARVEELAEAQKRTEERLARLETTVQELAEAQKRTEARVEELAEAQKRTEERLARLETTVQELAEAQKRTEARVEELAEAQKRTEERMQLFEERLGKVEQRLGQIGNLLGLDVEVEAQEVLLYVLERKGYRVLASPHALDMDSEVDIVVPVESAEGNRFWVLTEVKSRARLKSLRRWADRLRSAGFVQQLAEQGVTQPYLFYLFGLRVYQVVEEEAQRLELGVLDPDGERVAPAPIR